MPTGMIAAVVFDLYETLLTEHGTSQPRAGALGSAFGLDAARWRRAWKSRRPLVVRGALSFRAALRQTAADAGAAVDEPLIDRIVDQRAAAKAAVFERIDPAVSEVVARLRAAGIRLACISNGFAEDVAPWSRCQLAPFFDAALFSCEVGAAKPESTIYLMALARLRVTPRRTLYVGDGGDDELAGAAAAGLHVAAARWFVGQQDTGAPSSDAPRLARCDDVLRYVAARRSPGTE